jgi:pyruvate dehydrogenase E1 component alpha subunit
MLYVRRVEERIMALYGEQEMRCPTHFSIGQEAVAAAVCALLRPEDIVISAHRSHAHYLGKGGDLAAMFAELYGKSTGCAAGKGGSMHLIDQAVNFIGCVPIVGSTIPIGVGASFGATLQGRPALTAIFFGDGATETGVFHEALNWAAVQRLPVLFVCENNQYSVNTPLPQRQPDGRRMTALAEGHGIPTAHGDGQRVEEVHDVARPVIERVRAGGGPAFLQFETYRRLEHCGPNTDLHLGYRPPGEFDHWLARDPLRLHEEELRDAGLLDDAGLAAMTAEIDRAIDAAAAAAKAAPFPARDQIDRHVYA